MENIQYYFGSYSIDHEKVPVPDNLKEKDARADPVAKAAVFAANDVIKNSNYTDISSLSVIVVNREGCASHVKRIADGLSKRVARQGFFARGGPQTLATYTALALGSHGAAFTLVGNKNSLDIALSSAIYMASQTPECGVLLTVVARSNDEGYRAVSVLINSRSNKLNKIDSSSNVFQSILKKLVSVFVDEVKNEI